MLSVARIFERSEKMLTIATTNGKSNFSANIQHPKSALTVFSGFSENNFQNRLYTPVNERQKISKIFIFFLKHHDLKGNFATIFTESKGKSIQKTCLFFQEKHTDFSKNKKLQS